MKHMTDLQTVQVNNLIEKAGQNGSRIVKQSTSDPVLYLDRLAAIFRHVSIELQPGQPHPAAQLAIEGKFSVFLVRYFCNFWPFGIFLTRSGIFGCDFSPCFH